MQQLRNFVDTRLFGWLAPSDEAVVKSVFHTLGSRSTFIMLPDSFNLPKGATHWAWGKNTVHGVGSDLFSHQPATGLPIQG
jgi:hypothetical protein